MLDYIDSNLQKSINIFQFQAAWNRIVNSLYQTRPSSSPSPLSSAARAPSPSQPVTTLASTALTKQPPRAAGPLVPSPVFQTVAQVPVSLSRPAELPRLTSMAPSSSPSAPPYPFRDLPLPLNIPHSLPPPPVLMSTSASAIANATNGSATELPAKVTLNDFILLKTIGTEPAEIRCTLWFTAISRKRYIRTG